MANLLLTSECNFSCNYCFLNNWMEKQGNRPEYFSLDDLQQVIRWIENTAPPNDHRVQLMGGEPLLHPQIEQVVEMLLSSKLTITTILTNGVVDSRIIEEIRDKSPQTQFLVNVNSPDSYEPKEWERLEQNLEILAPKLEGKKPSSETITEHARLKFSITFYQPGQSYQYILDLAKKYNSHYIRYSPGMPANDLSNSYVDFEKLERVKPVLIAFVKDAVSNYIDVNLDCVLPPCIFDIEEWSLLNNLTSSLTSVCNNCMDIFPDLNVVYCGALKGHIDSIHIGELPYGEIFNEIDNRAEMLRNYELSRCSSCDFFRNKQCQGYCLGYKVKKMKEEGIWPGS